MSSSTSIAVPVSVRANTFSERHPEQLLTREEAARYLCLSPQTLALWAHTKSQELRYFKVGGRARYKKSDLDNFIQRGEVSIKRPVGARDA